jgi:hypothetical protein
MLYTRRTSSLSIFKTLRKGAGVGMPRKTATSRPIAKEDKCHFNFTIKLTQTCWFIKSGCGSCLHNGHSYKAKDCIRVKTALIPDEEKELVAQLMDNSAGTRVTANVVRENIGHSISRQQCRYIFGSKNADAKDGLSEAEKLLDDMRAMQESGEGSFVALYHTVPVSHQHCTVLRALFSMKLTIANALLFLYQERTMISEKPK